jgi:hypothetical protein
MMVVVGEAEAFTSSPTLSFLNFPVISFLLKLKSFKDAVRTHAQPCHLPSMERQVH